MTAGYSSLQCLILIYVCAVGEGPSQEHETARFKLANNIQELWYFTKSQLGKLEAKDAPRVLEDMNQRHRWVGGNLILG